MTRAIYPGSFDPPTNGHIDIVERASRHFESVVIAVVTNAAKAPLFSIDERVSLLKGVLSHVGNVEVVPHAGLTVDLAKKHGIRVIVKGLRAASDLEYELQQAQMNSSLAPDVDTFFIATNPQWSFISSSLIKDVARHGGSVEDYVPPAVTEALRRHSR
ncbi:MAG: pantetheine-phosphate adenylyltransferase [Dehalococcoidia bacterium]